MEQNENSQLHKCMKSYAYQRKVVNIANVIAIHRLIVSLSSKNEGSIGKRTGQCTINPEKPFLNATEESTHSQVIIEDPYRFYS